MRARSTSGGRGANLERLRTKYGRLHEFPKPDSVDERRWAIFVAYCREGQSSNAIGEKAGISVARVLTIIREVGAVLDSAKTPMPAASPLTVNSPIEEMALSSRARNALRSLGCKTVDDVLRLDLSGARGIGRKSRLEVLSVLGNSGLSHAEEAENLEMRSIHRSLDRMHSRVSAALGAVAKEITVLRKRIRKRMNGQDGRGTAA